MHPIFTEVLSVPGTVLSQVMELASTKARVCTWVLLTLCPGHYSKGIRYYRDKMLSKEYNLDISHLCFWKISLPPKFTQINLHKSDLVKQPLYFHYSFLKQQQNDLFATQPSPHHFIFYFFGCCGACGILVPWAGMEPGPSTVKAGVLTTEPPGNSPHHFNMQRSRKESHCKIGWLSLIITLNN